MCVCVMHAHRQTSTTTCGVHQDCSGRNLEDSLEACVYRVVFNKMPISLRGGVVALTMTGKVHLSAPIKSRRIMKDDWSWSQHGEL